MGEDLKRCNLKFREVLENVKKRKAINKEEESLAYFFFLAGFGAGSGVQQMIT